MNRRVFQRSIRWLTPAAFFLSLAVFVTPWSPSSQSTGFSLSLDLNEATGDQAVSSLDLLPGQPFSVQMFATDIQSAQGVSARLRFDASQVVYEELDPGDALPNVQAVARQDSTSLRVSVSSLGGSATVSEGWVATLRFRTTAAFTDTEVWLVDAERTRGGQTETVSLAVGVALQVVAPPSPDFDGNGMVGFSDFVAFARFFGARRGDAKYAAPYDLNHDEEIAFEDFVIFARSFGESVNRAPVFAEPAPLTRSVMENTSGGEPIGDPVTATDADGDSITYGLRGVHADSFAIGADTGQLFAREGVAYDHEGNDTYSVTVRAADGRGGRATVAVDITVADVDEPPSAAPDSVRVASRDTALAVTWLAAIDEPGRPPVSGYEVGHKVEEAEIWPGGLLVEGRAGTSVTLAGLTNDQAYQVRVRTLNDEGRGPWSAPVAGVPAVGPRPRGELRDQTALIGRDLEINLASLFTRPARGTWTFGATSSNEGVATVAVSDTMAVVRGVVPGRTTITATASNRYGNSSWTTFDVVVTTPPAPPPPPPPTTPPPPPPTTPPPPPPTTPPPPPPPPQDTPTVSSITFTSTPASGQNGTYKLGDLISVTASFSEAVTVTGTPQVDLRIGSTLRRANYASGSSTSALLFQYTVQATDEDTDGATINANGLKLNNGSIRKNNTTTSAQLGHGAEVNQSAHKVDGMVPALTGAAVTGDKLTLSYGEALDDDPIPANGDFAVTVEGTARNVAAVGVNGSAVTLTLASAAILGETVRLTYTPGTHPIRDLAQNPAGAYANGTVVNLTGGVCDRTPQVSDAIVEAAGASDCNAVTAAHLWAITELPLNERDISALKTGDFSGLTALAKLNLAGNRLSTLPANLFSDLPAINLVSLRENNISTLPASLFSNPSPLKDLDLTHNVLSGINKSTFSGLTALERIGLANNRLQESSLPSGIFASLPSLKFINLGTNHFPDITADFFSDLTGLEILYLTDVGLTTLTGDLFSNLSSLNILSLSHNDISSVSANAFSGLTSLEYLWMDFADLESSVLPSGVFSSLTSLRTLSLRVNRLESLPAGVFLGLTSLTDLHVSENPIDPLPITISLERIDDGQFNASAHTGAPFNVTLPLQLVNGSVSGGAASIVIPRGRLESDAVTVTRTVGSIGAVTVDIESLPVPPPPPDHRGYALVRPNDEPLEVLAPVPKVIIYPTAVTVAAGYSNVYRVALNAQPTADVTVSVNAPSNSEFSVYPTERTFTPVTFDMLQIVTVAADTDAVAADAVAISHAVSGGNYHDLDVDDVVVTVAAAPSTSQSPVFTSGGTFDIKENETEVGTVVAMDPDAIDYVTGYEISGGDHQAQFAVSDEGALSFIHAPDFERPVATGNVYAVEVTATSGMDARQRDATQTIQVNVEDVEERPGTPPAPVLSVRQQSREIAVGPSSSPTENTGPDVTSWDIRYRVKDNRHLHSHTTVAEPNWEFVIQHAVASWVYEAQVRAESDEGVSDWSPFAEATIPNEQPVANGSINDLTLPAGGAAEVVTVDGVFADPDGFRLTASSSNETVAAAGMYGNAVMVDPLSAGSATITLTATDPWGLSGSYSFDATIQTPSLQAPTLSIADSVATLGFTDAFLALETRAYDVRIRHKTPTGPWAVGCISITNPEENSAAITTSRDITASGFFEPGTLYEADYIYLGSGCESSAAGLSSAAAEATTSGTPSFDIETVFPEGPPSSDHLAVIEAAVARWERIVTHDVPNYRLSATQISQLKATYPGVTVPEVVDDVIIFIRIGSYSYVSALHRLELRPSVSSLPWQSEISIGSPYIFVSVLSQRIGHSMGFHESVWKHHYLLQHESSSGRPLPQPDTHFSGAAAIDAFDAAGGTSYPDAKVPVENERDWAWNHSWRVDVFPASRELMGPYAGASLSAITIQAMADLGYRVDVTQADPYTLPLSGLSKVTEDLLEEALPEGPEGQIYLDFVAEQREHAVVESTPFVLTVINSSESD